MIKHYNDLIFSTVVKDKDYSFKNPLFGKSNTDQSFYDPRGSFTSNQSKIGASAMTHLHNNAESDVAEIRKNHSFLPQNMTQEEVQAMIIQQKEVVESAINDVSVKLGQIKDEIDFHSKIEQKSISTEE